MTNGTQERFVEFLSFVAGLREADKFDNDEGTRANLREFLAFVADLRESIALFLSLST